MPIWRRRPAGPADRRGGGRAERRLRRLRPGPPADRDAGDAGGVPGHRRGHQPGPALLRLPRRRSRFLGQGSVGGIPIPGLIFLVALLVTAFLLARTPLGLSLSAIGYNETASRFSGLSVARLKLALYTASGLAAGLAALLFVARRNTAKADIGTGMELDVITAVVLGGTSIFGGRGSLLGTVLGVLLIHETREFVSWQWSRDELNLIVVGLLLLLSVLADSLLSRRRSDSR